MLLTHCNQQQLPVGQLQKLASPPTLPSLPSAGIIVQCGICNICKLQAAVALLQPLHVGVEVAACSNKTYFHGILWLVLISAAPWNSMANNRILQRGAKFLGKSWALIITNIPKYL